MSYVLSLDEGTTSCRAIVFDDRGQICSLAQQEFTQYFPQPGWVEHDAEEIWTAQLAVAKEAITKASLKANDISAVGITNQRETTIVWDRETGRPIGPAIVWQDRRTSGICDAIRERGDADLIAKKSGLVVDAYFSATKIAWILDHYPDARKKADAGRLAFGTVDSWLIWKLTNGARHITDVTNASRTMLFNIQSRTWDEELLRIFNVPRNVLPEVCESSEVIAKTSAEIFGSALPIAGIAGDQQAALFGQLCVNSGETKTTYGTGCFMLQNTGATEVQSKNRLISTIASAVSGEKAYAIEGSVFIGGAVVQWLRDGLGVIKTSAEIRTLATSVPDSDGIMFVPAFAGLGAPYWDSKARGMIIGLTRGTTAAHIARAAVESIAHQVADLVDAMQRDSGIRPKEMRVDGGATCDNLLMQLQADLLGIPLVRPVVTETTALGAAYLAGLAVGVWSGVSQLKELEKIDRSFEPNPSANVEASRERWRRAVERCKNWE